MEMDPTLLNELVSESNKPEARFQRLAELTDSLIKEAVRSGCLAKHPYAEIRAFKTQISSDVSTYLEDRTVLVTGAAGCVGSRLSESIVLYAPKRLVLLDIDQGRLENVRRVLCRNGAKSSISTVSADVGDQAAIEDCFAESKPNVVFHIAAEREPGKAETNVRRAVLSNMLGTRNICEASVRHDVKKVIHASTGKCRFIYEPRVYPATKKFAETIVRTMAAKHGIEAAMVRFHHIVDNSIAERTFRSQLNSGDPITVFQPATKKQHGQNADEAVAMLLNAGLHGKHGEVFGSTHQMDRFSVLALALHTIHRSGKRHPIVITTPKREQGYLTSEFGGTRRRDDSTATTHSFNTLETANPHVYDALHLVHTDLTEFDLELSRELVDSVITKAKSGDARTSDELKQHLFDSLFAFAADVYRRAKLDLVVKSFIWGVEPEHMPGHSDMRYHFRTVDLHLRGFEQREFRSLDRDDRDDLVKALRYLDGLAEKNPDDLSNENFRDTLQSLWRNVSVY